MDLIVFEDEHLLVANKPAGWNTHAPAPFAGEGLYEWLKNREPERHGLSIIHRLDKETSGLIVFGKSDTANRSLSRQFERHHVEKKYLLRTRGHVQFQERRVRSSLVRAGDKYVARPALAGALMAETLFRTIGEWKGGMVIEAIPVTGRTHQIRVHAADGGFPILGDHLYGGASWPRLCLHSARLSFEHPATGQMVSFSAEPAFTGDARAALRDAIIDPALTDAFRVIHGAADGWPGLYVDKFGDYLIAQSAEPLTGRQRERLEEFRGRAFYHKTLGREARTSPVCLRGVAASKEIVVRENGLSFSLRLEEGYSAGLFLDQRENRRRLLTTHVAPEFQLPARAEVLNTFAYTCAFSLCAAAAKGRVTSLDLSRNYLEWGKRNFVLNGLDPAGHDFIFGDVFDWLRRLGKKKRLFDVIVLDPPTFSRSRESGVFQAEKDFGKLAAAALSLLKSGGVLFASTNAAGFAPENFLETLNEAVARSDRRVLRRHYAPQPPDFPIERAEPAYLKTAWLRVS